jgi:hypothetical protein
MHNTSEATQMEVEAHIPSILVETFCASRATDPSHHEGAQNHISRMVIEGIKMASMEVLLLHLLKVTELVIMFLVYKMIICGPEKRVQGSLINLPYLNIAMMIRFIGIGHFTQKRMQKKVLQCQRWMSFEGWLEKV